jgi:predicted ATPase
MHDKPSTSNNKFFTISERGQKLSSSNSPKACLVQDNWDDYSFRTYFELIIYDENGKRHDIGGVKIGQFGLTKEQRRPVLPPQFDELDDSFFSLGQSDKYYETLNSLSARIKAQVMKGLKDVVADISLFERALKEAVTKDSLLRSVSSLTVRNQFRRLVEGGARLSRYNFSYTTAPSRRGSGALPFSLLFEVEPQSMPPTNIHVLIGRNGVGKTHTLNQMTRSLIGENTTPNQFGAFSSDETTENTELFANLVSVTFSAFDEFTPLRERKDATAGLKYSYVGLKRLSNKEDSEPSAKTPNMLRTEFVKSAYACLKGFKRERWQRSMQMLETDPIFKEAEVASLINDNTLANTPDSAEFQKEARQLFDRLSSGHKIVLLTMTRLVETVEEQTLVLLDEPEAHLHPPLLSAFIRALSDLLVYRNGVAIIATHSPVVLQEVPKSCVWKLRRNGEEAVAERPEIETFGENVGVLTREVFGLEVTQSGFHRLLQSTVEENLPYKATLKKFGDELGAEARAILRSLIAIRDAEKEL